MGRVENTLCRVETRDGGVVLDTEAPRLVFGCDGGAGVVESWSKDGNGRHCQ